MREHNFEMPYFTVYLPMTYLSTFSVFNQQYYGYMYHCVRIICKTCMEGEKRKGQGNF